MRSYTVKGIRSECGEGVDRGGMRSAVLNVGRCLGSGTQSATSFDPAREMFVWAGIGSLCIQVSRKRRNDLRKEPNFSTFQDNKPVLSGFGISSFLF